MNDGTPPSLVTNFSSTRQGPQEIDDIHFHRVYLGRMYGFFRVSIGFLSDLFGGSFGFIWGILFRAYVGSL